MERAARLALNPRLLFVAKFFANIKILNAVITLFFLHRGLPIDQVIYLSAIFGAATLVVEVPTGYIADRWGRRATLQAGMICLALSQFINLFASDFLTFAASFIVLAFASACFSGTEEATLYDSLKELGRESQMTRYWGRLLSAQNLPKIFFPPIGAFIAKDLLDWQFQTLLWVDIAAALVGMLVLFFVIEPKHERDVEAYEEGIFRESVRTVRERPLLLRAALNKVTPAIVSVLVWRAYQPYLMDLGASVIWLGIFYVFMHGAVFSLRWASEWAEAQFGDARVLNATAWMMALALLCSTLVPNAWIVSLFLVLFFAGNALREPMYSHWMNRQIHSRSRATTLSNLNVFRAAIDVPLMLAGGALAVLDVRWTLLLCASLCLFVFLFLRIPADDGRMVE